MTKASAVASVTAATITDNQLTGERTGKIYMYICIYMVVHTHICIRIRKQFENLKC